MKRVLFGVTGAGVLVFCGLAALGGRTLLAASATRMAQAVRLSGPAAPRVRARTVVHVKAAGEPRQMGSLVVPLRQRTPNAGALQAVNKVGKPIGQCPLQHTDVVADVAGFVARVTVTQQYRNPFTEPIEAIYTFPLPEDAAVDDMVMTIGDRSIVGDIKRREEARQIYDAAKAAGQAAALLDQERPNIFTQAVANVMPGQDVTITIRYVNTLKYDDGRYEFTFPMVVGPRFIPGGGGYTEPGKRGDPGPVQEMGADPGATPVVTDAEKITPPITPPGTRSGHDIALKVNLDTGLVLGDVRSVLHDVDVEKAGESKATVTLSPADNIPNRDFVLRYTVAGPQLQTGVLAHGENGSGYFTLILQPPAAPKPSQIAPKEMVFVIDQTGSQMGWPIEKSKETMKHVIQRLNPGDTFQLIGFNTSVFPCFTQAVSANADNIHKALAYLETLQGAGGTDILKAADYALKMPDDPKRLRIICFMTDGYVGNDMQIIDYIRKNRGRARMFPFGIGNGVNRFLIEGMGREGRGQAEFVTLEEPGQEAAERFYRRIQNPVLLDPQVDFHGLPVEDVYPKVIPDVFSSGPIVVKGRFTKAADGVVTVRGMLGGKPWEEKVPVAFPLERAEGAGLESLWARARVEDLQAQDWLGAQMNKPNPGIKEEIIQTALEHRLMSQYTSFVAVEKKVVNQGGKQRTVDVPVEMPQGVAYEGIFGKEVLAESLAMAPAAPAARASGAAGGTSLYAQGANSPAPLARKATTLGISPVPLTAAPPPAASPLSPPVQALGTVFSYSDGSESPVKPDPPTFEERVADGDKDAMTQLDRKTPVEKRDVLRRAKMDKQLWDLAALVKKQGTNGTLRLAGHPVVEKGRVRVQITLNQDASKAMARLKALGFAPSETTILVVTGTIAVERLDSLLALPSVQHVEPATG